MTEQPLERPTSITVFGVLNIMFGLLGLCGTAGSFMTLQMADELDTGANYSAKVMAESAGYSNFLAVMGVLGLISSVALIVAGIGLLIDKPWARKLSLIWVAYILIANAVSMAANVFFLILPMYNELESSGSQFAAQFYGTTIGIVGGTCVSLLYPVFLAIWMTRAHVINWLAINE